MLNPWQTAAPARHTDEMAAGLSMQEIRHVSGITVTARCEARGLRFQGSASSAAMWVGSSRLDRVSFCRGCRCSAARVVQCGQRTCPSLREGGRGSWRDKRCCSGFCRHSLYLISLLVKSGVGDRKLSENPVSCRNPRAPVTTRVSSEDGGLSSSQDHWAIREVTLHLLEEKKKFLYLSKAGHGIGE